MLTIICITIYALLGIGIAAVALPVIDRTREVTHRAAVDFVEVIARWQHSQLDVASRRAKLESERGMARLELTARRFELLELPGRPELPEEVESR